MTPQRWMSTRLITSSGRTSSVTHGSPLTTKMNTPIEEVKKMTRGELLPILDVMQKYGGSFMKHLAVAMCHADSKNLQKLVDTFAGDLAHYKKHFAQK